MEVTELYTDEQKEAEGVWHDYGDDGKVLLAGMGNRKFQQMYDRLMKPHLRRQQRGTLDPRVQTEIVCKCMARHIVLDWKGFTSIGKPLPYSEENAFELLMKSRAIRNDWSEMATDDEQYRQQQIEDAEKNSSSASDSHSLSPQIG